ncbi:AHR [Cordylochernes scorpioides]|uniref:AHR n=1 Tax=Cordylochernes scorpioides TaxID=51811 RepID=A0ABY6LQQ1_9ARAC|nr:AHR [Cordylochernes scorpioides]
MSDICHQSVYELVHSEDREELQRHLLWNSQFPAERAGLSLQEALLHDHAHFLERNFTVRFRCLLDNTSGFLRLDIRGRIKVLHGQNHKTEEPPLALFAVCTPFGPPSLLEMPQKESMFKSKHKLDLSLVNIDQRGKQILGYSDSEMAAQGGYDLVHFDDLAYVASAHQELLKTGASGLIAYRLQTKEGDWQWLQTSARLVYKNSKPDFILCTHRPLMEEEGRDLLGKRTMDFKVTYLDGGLGALTERSGLLADNELVLRCQRNRRYKSQIKDILHTCRKRKASSSSSEPYIEEQPYGSNNPVYGATYPADSPLPYTAVSQNLFLDNSRFLSPENFLHYRAYYPEYGQYPATNGLLDPARGCFPSYDTAAKDEKLYPCQLEARVNGESRLKTTSGCCEGYTAGTDPLRPFLELKDKEADAPRQSVLMWGSSGGYEPAARLGCPKTDVCRWASAPKSASPLPSSSPASGKVAPPGAGIPYPPDLGLEVGPLTLLPRPALTKVQCDSQEWNPPKLLASTWRHHLPMARSDVLRRHDGSPLLSISEVTNTLLNHE